MSQAKLEKIKQLLLDIEKQTQEARVLLSGNYP